MRAHRFCCPLLAGLLALLLLMGCGAQKQKVIAPPPPPFSSFPPQKAMESGDYAGFIEENLSKLKKCSGQGECDVALFSLGFLHAYSGSGHYSPRKALYYFNELVATYPQSPWAFQAKGWTDVLGKSIAFEAQCRQLKGKLKTRNTAIGELQKQMERSRDIDVEMDRKERELLQ